MLTYQSIKHDLADHLRGRYRPGQRLPSIFQLAEELGLGKTNTHRAVRELVREGVLVSRPGMGTFLRDPRTQARIDPLAGQGRALEGKTAGIVMVTGTEPLMSRAATAAATWLQTLGARTHHQLASDDSSEALALALEQQTDCDGLILFQADSASQLHVAEQPTVLVTSSLPLGDLRDGRFDLVTPDSHQGALLAGRHLRRCACETYLCVGVGTDSGWDHISIERFNGFRCGLGFPHQVRPVMVSTYKSDNALAAVAPLLRQLPGPVGVFACSDDLAIGVGLAAIALGRKFGQDFHLVGFDGQQRGRRFTAGPLSTMDIPTELMGVSAARRLAMRLLAPDDLPRHTQLPCSFFQGITSGQETHHDPAR